MKAARRAAPLDPLAVAKLGTSGLTVADAAALGITSLTRAQTQALHVKFHPLRSMRIAYHGPDGSPISDWPKGAPFYRVRYLEEPVGFDAMVKKAPRYVQLPGTAPVAYYPRWAGWRKVCEDADTPLVLTEGELKAAKATLSGFPTIGLGGVYNWRSYKMGVPFLPSLDPVAWERRNVYIAFDSDVRENRMVLEALRELAEQLHRRGAYVHLASLPQLEGLEKVGLDDFLVRSGPDAFAGLLHEAEPLGLTAPLWGLNSRYVYAQDPGLVYDVETRAKGSPNAFKDHMKSTEEYLERDVKPNGEVGRRAVSAAGAWLRWPLRNEVRRLTYRPGQGRYVDGEYNIWPGWGVQPKPKVTRRDVAPFLELLAHLFTGAEPEAMEWFLDWCACPLQRPGVKLFSAVVFHGVRHGTGKSFVGYTLGRVYGKNFTEISQMDLHNSFNEWAEGKQLVLGDDVTGPNRRADADFLKKLITQRELRVNGKYVPTYVVPDCVNYFFTANHPDSFFLEDDDRRFFIHEVVVGPIAAKGWYTRYERWLDGGGSSSLFRWLLDRDIRDFNHAGPALRTAAKQRMTMTVRSDLGEWVRTLRDAPGQVLKVGTISIDKDLFTSAELLELYDPERRTGTTANGLGRELSRAGFRQVSGGRPVKLSDGTQARYFAARQPERWLAASTGDAARHVDGFALALGAKESKRAGRY